jgi:drug/metabolite transporter (DMT)-like permease
MGKSAQDNGIGTTSVAVKMGLVIPVVAAIIIYQEAVGILRVVGVLAALAGVVLITYQPQSKRMGKKGNAWMLVILFVGSGLLDTLLNYVEKRALGELSPALFSAIGFGIAAVIGSVVLISKVLRKKTRLELRNVLGGIALGVPNYFSIYFLIMAIRDEMDDSVTYAVNNVGIVLLAFLLGILLFSEAVTKTKVAGVALAVLAILMLMF